MSPLRVSLEAHGSGPAVLFLHGTPTPWDVLRPIANACPSGTTLLAALPGYGAAAPWSTAPTIDTFAEVIEAAAVDAGFSELSVVAFSGGAYHAIHLAVRGVVCVRSLALLGGLAEITPEVSAGFRGFAAALRAGASLAGVATERFLSPTFAKTHPEACARVEAWLHATTPENLARELDAFAAAGSLLPKLAAWDGRLLARTGELDLASPVANAAGVVRAARSGVLQVVPGAGHALLEEDEAATVAAVVGFLGA